MNLKTTILIYKNIKLYHLNIIIKTIFFPLSNKTTILKLQYDTNIK